MPDPRDAVLALLARVHAAAALPDALDALLDFAAARRGDGRALVLLERDGRLRGERARGWPGVEPRALLLPLAEAPAALAEALGSGRPTIVEDTGGPLGLAGYAAVPLPGPGGRAFGVLLLEGTSEEGVEETALAARHAGPALFRAAETDALRRSAAYLDRQRQLFVSLVHALPDPVLVTDPAHAIMLENRRAESLFRAGEEDGDERRRVVGINNLLLSSFLTRGAADAPAPVARELALVEPDRGADLLFEILSTPLPPELAGEGAVLLVLRDVTALKRASTELEHQIRRVRQAEVRSRRERDRLNLILENVGDPILVTDDEAQVVLLNREADRLFAPVAERGLPPTEPRPTAENDARFHAFVAEFMAGPETTRTEELTLVDPTNGALFPAEVVSGKILNEQGGVTAAVSVIHDLTKVVENERLAHELRLLNEGLEGRIHAATAALEERNRRLEWQSRELARAYRLKSEFLASMSHELRTPINALLGYSSLMRDRIYGELTERQEGALDRMSTASRHLLELVNDILDLAKIEAGKMPVHIHPLDLAELVRELAGTLEPMVRAKGLQLEVELEPELPPMLSDATRVRQILLNLLSNAVKFTREGGVRVRARREGAGVEISVADSGIGIAPEHLETIFDDFRQVDQSSTRQFGGTGLGLSIVRKLLDLLGGRISVESRAEEGSTFTIWLPLESQEVVVPDASGTEPNGL